MAKQQTTIFELPDTKVKPIEYSFSDLEDLLIDLKPSRLTYLIGKFVKEVSLIENMRRDLSSDRKSPVRLILKRDSYWIQSEYLLPRYWHRFFYRIIELQGSKSGEIQDFLNMIEQKIRKQTFAGKAKELGSVNLFVFKTICDQYFPSPGSSTIFLLDEENGQILLRVEFSAEIPENGKTGIEEKTSYEKAYLRLSPEEEGLKSMLLQGDPAILQTQRKVILAAFDRRPAFQKHCLAQEKIVQVCFQQRFVEALKRVRSVHWHGAFTEEEIDLLWRLKQLQRISISGADLHTIPDQIQHFQQLAYLNLAQCNISDLPASVGQLPMLKKLWLRGNQLTQLPSDWANLQMMEEICLDMNPIREFPAVLAKMRAMKWIRMTDCEIKSFPKEIRELDKLRYISLRRNKIQEIPVYFLHLPSLTTLEIGGNPLSVESLTIFKEKRDQLNPDLKVDVLDDDFFRMI